MADGDGWRWIRHVKEGNMEKDVTILIVEDSLTQALQLQYLLEKNGYSVVAARHGREALDHLQGHEPSLIISDIVMPEMDGYELCTHIRADERLKDIPIILLTALSDPHDVIRALECGADNFVTKPYNESFLLSRIRNILLNQELRQHSVSEMGIEIIFGGRKHFITSNRMQILDLLFSTYENAVEKNRELERVNNELIAMQRELEQRNEELKKLNDQKNQLLGIAAHDLRTPLGAISSYAQFLMEEAAKVLSKEHFEFLSTIKSSSDFLLSMVNELLDLSKIEAGKLELDLKPVNLISLIEHNVLLNRFLAENKQIRVTFQSDLKCTRMMLDPPKITQVLDNLISNAIKFSQPGTTIEIRASEQDNRAVISVRDQGPGIPASELDRLFKPFEITSVKSTRGEKSTGLGLAIVRKLVEGHNGHVWVDSQVGKGSTFTFSLPIVLPPEEPPASHGPSTDRSGAPAMDASPEPQHRCKCRTPLKILLAEDTPVNQRLLVRMLERGGHQVTVVENGRDALAACERQRYDLILMDVHMPELDGFMTTKAIRERERGQGARIPIVAMTALDSCSDRDLCLAAGMDAYLSKPVQAKALLDLIETLAGS